MHRGKLQSYSITSSARAETDGGIVSPIALAVFKLMTNWLCAELAGGRAAPQVPCYGHRAERKLGGAEKINREKSVISSQRVTIQK